MCCVWRRGREGDMGEKGRRRGLIAINPLPIFYFWFLISVIFQTTLIA
jgi:hypothetical protein